MYGETHLVKPLRNGLHDAVEMLRQHVQTARVQQQAALTAAGVGGGGGGGGTSPGLRRVRERELLVLAQRCDILGGEAEAGVGDGGGVCRCGCCRLWRRPRVRGRMRRMMRHRSERRGLPRIFAWEGCGLSVVRSMSGRVEEHLQFSHATTMVFPACVFSCSFTSGPPPCLGPAAMVVSRRECVVPLLFAHLRRRTDAAVVQARQNDEMT